MAVPFGAAKKRWILLKVYRKHRVHFWQLFQVISRARVRKQAATGWVEKTRAVLSEGCGRSSLQFDMLEVWFTLSNIINHNQDFLCSRSFTSLNVIHFLNNSSPQTQRRHLSCRSHSQGGGTSCTSSCAGRGCCDSSCSAGKTHTSRAWVVWRGERRGGKVGNVTNIHSQSCKEEPNKLLL